MRPPVFLTQPQALPACGCGDLHRPASEPDRAHPHERPPRADAFSTLLDTAVTAAATPPLAPWPLPAAEGGPRPAATPTAETRIDRDRRQGSRRRRG